MIGHVIPQMKGIKEWNYILKIFTNITLFRPLGPILAPLKRGPRKRVKSRCWHEWPRNTSCERYQKVELYFKGLYKYKTFFGPLEPIFYPLKKRGPRKLIIHANHHSTLQYLSMEVFLTIHAVILLLPFSGPFFEGQQ